MYNDADEMYISLHCLSGEPKSYALSFAGSIEPLYVCIPTNKFEPVDA